MMWYNQKVAAKKRWRMILENWTTRDSMKHSKCEISRQFWKRKYTLKKVKSNQARNWFYAPSPELKILWFREFDPGSGLTLAACITHSSRTVKKTLRGLLISGGRVSNAWATCPFVGDNDGKLSLIPHNQVVRHRTACKDLLQKDGLASD